jgi:hypothetical protein
VYREEYIRFCLPFFCPMSFTAGNKLVSKEVRVCYRGHMLQQVGYQRTSVFVAAETLTQKHAFRNTPQYNISYCDLCFHVALVVTCAPLTCRISHSCTNCVKQFVCHHIMGCSACPISLLQTRLGCVLLSGVKLARCLERLIVYINFRVIQYIGYPE